MARQFVNSSGSRVNLGRELGKGGEGSVFELPGHSNQVAKLYHKNPDPKKQAKLRHMSSAHDDELLGYAAWPLETIHTQKGGPVVGFIMHKITGRDPIHMLYSPAHRRKEYPKQAWHFLLWAARNTAAAFTTLHEKNHVVGDVNQGNVLVGRDTKVGLIDCDSFQVNANGMLHYCEVGVSHFTPPELQGLSSFHDVARTQNHDNFGLALLVFHLLFGGRHPYAGVPLRDDVGESLETDIQRFRYAYARDSQSRGLKPPPKSIPVSIVPEPIVAMFHLAFTEKGATGERPTAGQWVSALDELRQQLKRCRTSRIHVFSNHLGQCPWCALENKGVIYFIDINDIATGTVTSSGFQITRIWTAVESITAPPTVTIPNDTQYPVTGRAVPQGVGKSNLVVVWRVFIVGAALGLFLLLPEAWFIFGIGALIGLWVVNSDVSPEFKAETQKRQESLKHARINYSQVKETFERKCSSETFDKKKQHLSILATEYQEIPNMQKREIENLHTTAKARQKHQFLGCCFIDSATIPGVGAAKKAALRSFGIETAADVTKQKVRAVKGFGEVLTMAVMDWKSSCERRFKFNPANAVSEADKNTVRSRFATRKRAIETELTSGPAELQKIRQKSIENAETLFPQLQRAAKVLAQAEADMAVLNSQ